jgi:hypothetical protein
MAVVWHLTKNHHQLPRPVAIADHLTPLEKSLRVVERMCRGLNWERILNQKEVDGKTATQARAGRVIALTRFLPALKMLHEHAGGLYPGPVDGFAVIEVEHGPMALAETARGYCIVETEADASELFDRWDQNDAEFESPRERRAARERYAVRPVRVDLENGLTFTDTGERYEGFNK